MGLKILITPGFADYFFKPGLNLTVRLLSTKTVPYKIYFAFFS
jgi:hypothetical protein